MNCKKCGAPIENNSGFCGMCGTPVEPQINAATDIFNMGAPVQPAEPAQPAAPAQPVVEPMQPMPEVTPVQPVVEPIQPMPEVTPIQPVVEPVQPVVEPVQPSQPEIIEPVQPVVEPIQPMPTLESETIQQPNQLPIMDMNNGGVPPVNTPAQPSSYDIKPEKKKGSALPIILIILILLGVGGYFAYKYFFNKPDKVVKGLVNKAYDKFEMPLKKYNDKTDSVLVDAELSINTNIDGLEDLNGMKFNLTTGIDYKNSKVEVGLAYLENNTKILEGMMYVIDKNAYMVLKDIYPNPLKLNTEEINFEEIASETTTATPEDIEYITKRLKDIFLESLNMNDFKQSSAKITLNGSETKVKKISYTLDEIKTQKLMNNMIDNILKDETLVNKLSAIYNTDSETLKELLEDSKVELSDSTSDETIEISIYTKGITDDFAGMDIELPNGATIEIRKNNTNTEIKANMNGAVLALTITEESKEKTVIDIKINVITEEITGKLIIETKEIDAKTTESTMTFDMNYEEKQFGYVLKMKEQIGADIANVDVSNAKSIDDLTTEEINMIEQKLTEKMLDSKLYNMLDSALNELDELEYDDYYDYDYDYDFNI